MRMLRQHRRRCRRTHRDLDRTTIRITSNRVTEAPIIYDTSQPTIVPPAPQVAASKPADTVDVSSAAKTDGGKTSDARVEAMAQIDTVKPAVSKPKPKPRKIARHDPPRQQYVQRQAWAQPSFFPGFFRLQVRSILEPHFGSKRIGESVRGPHFLFL